MTFFQLKLIVMMTMTPKILDNTKDSFAPFVWKVFQARKLGKQNSFWNKHQCILIVFSGIHTKFIV